MELKLLIVEDDRLLAEAVSDYFTGKSWETDVVYDGDSAVEKAERKSYQMILLDVMLASRQGRILRVQKDPGDDGDAGVLYHGACDGGGRTQRLCCRRG